MFFTVMKAIAFFLVKLFYKIKVVGAENIPAGGGYMVFANHQHLIDPIFVVYAVRKKLCFMAKKEIFSSPVAGKFFRALGAFPVDRGKGDTGAIKEAEKSLKDGEIFCIFPEGTRSKTGKLGAYKNGAAYIALSTGADLLPIVIDYGKGVRPGSRITVSVKPVIKFSEVDLSGGRSTVMKNLTRRMRMETENALSEIRND